MHARKKYGEFNIDNICDSIKLYWQLLFKVPLLKGGFRGI
jgi:hypothetical protein